ncbi:MAG: response regulator [Alphaproteobacteria bacterium]
MKILLVDDHTLFRDALVQYINRANPKAQVLLAKDFDEGYSTLQNNMPVDLVLLDLKMPGMNGLDGLKTLIDEYPGLPIALMSGVAEPEEVTDAIELGISGYFPKTLSGKELLNGIQQVLAGERYIPLGGSSLEVMPAYYKDKSVKIKTQKTTADITLTPREKDVLGYLMKGASNKEIANDLNLQVVTVKLHIRGICRKLEANNRTQAALKAKELRLLSDVN